MEISDIKYGDKLYCYNSCNLTDDYLRVNQWYTICHLEIWFSYRYPNGNCKVAIIIDNLEESLCVFEIQELGNYFHTQKEHRKLKLDEIESR